jgi:hypothetical protein
VKGLNLVSKESARTCVKVSSAFSRTLEGLRSYHSLESLFSLILNLLPCAGRLLASASSLSRGAFCFLSRHCESQLWHAEQALPRSPVLQMKYAKLQSYFRTRLIVRAVLHAMVVGRHEQGLFLWFVVLLGWRNNYESGSREWFLRKAVKSEETRARGTDRRAFGGRPESGLRAPLHTTASGLDLREYFIATSCVSGRTPAFYAAYLIWWVGCLDISHDNLEYARWGRIYGRSSHSIFLQWLLLTNYLHHCGNWAPLFSQQRLVRSS